MEQLYISLAYKFVMLTLMLAEANNAQEKLNLPGWQPVTMSQVSTFNISPPRLRAGGSLETSNCIFGFGENKLQFIQWTEPNSELSLRARQMLWSKMESHVGTNEAYQLATNWLAKLEVDVIALEKKHPVSVQQQFCYPNGDLTASLVLLPRFEVRWGKNPSLPAVWVSIFGPTKTPLFIRQEDGSFIRRPNVIKPESISSLLAITSSDFANWTLEQKSNLVVKAAGNADLAVVLPESVLGASSPERNLAKPITRIDAHSASPKKTKTLLPVDRESSLPVRSNQN